MKATVHLVDDGVGICDTSDLQQLDFFRYVLGWCTLLGPLEDLVLRLGL
jgi:hypothetical protein